MSEIVIRIICDYIDASTEMLVREAISRSGAVRAWVVRPYRKMPGTHEVWAVVQPDGRPEDAAFEEIVRRLGSGWSPESDDAFARWAVWNRSEDRRFVMPAARWAHVELIRSR
jgi:hypothetical protein